MRVWAGPLTRMFVPEIRQSWCTAHAQKTSELNPPYLFLAAPGEEGGRSRDTEILICSWNQSATKHKLYSELHCLSGWGCPACAHIDVPCMTGWAQTWGPSELFYHNTWCSALPGCQNNRPEGVLPSGKKTSQICFPSRDAECHAEWGLRHFQAKLRHQPAFICMQSPEEGTSMLIPKEATFACAQTCHWHSLPIDRSTTRRTL